MGIKLKNMLKSEATRKNSPNAKAGENSILGLYLRELSSIKPLSREEELELARQVKAGSESAREALVRANLRFVVTVARRYRSSGIGLMDLIHEGNLGLIQAVDKFDPEMGFHLISYAVWSIRQAISSAVQKNLHPVRLPKHRADQLRNILKIKQSLKAEGKEDENVSLLADILNMAPQNIKHLLGLNRKSVSLDNMDQSGNAAVVEQLADRNTITPEEVLTHAEMKYQLNKCLRKLNHQEQEVLKMRYGIGRSSFSLNKIGQVIGLSRERIRQIEIKAILRLRNSKEGQQLAAFLPD